MKEYGLAPELRTFGAYRGDSLAGYYELRRDNDGSVKTAYFGLLPEFIGRGFGGGVAHECDRGSVADVAFSHTRLGEHLYPPDHPRALANYQARGMTIYKVEEE